MTSLCAEHVRMSVANIMVVMPWFEKDADFQLEVLRECLLWLRFMRSDTKARGSANEHLVFLTAACPSQDENVVFLFFLKNLSETILLVVQELTELIS